MHYQRKRKQRGMSLIEVLVSMLIIGMGLGMSISMIQASNRYAESAEYRAIALNEIESIVSSMHANALGGPAYVWGQANYQTQENYITTLNTLAAVNPPICVKNCDDAKQQLLIQGRQLAYARANADLTTWLDNLQIVLPNGQGAITSVGNLYTVTVIWRAMDETDSNIGQNKVSESINLTFTL